MFLVTGGTGLLGSQLVFDLIKAGEQVKVLKRKNSSLHLLKKKFAERPHLFSEIIFVDGDLLDVFSLEESLNGVTHVFNCAALVSFAPSEKKMMYQVNVEGTTNLVNACLEKKIKKLCHVSSVAALGRSEENILIDETAVWENSGRNSNYAISKYGAEREVWRAVAEGLDAVIVNPTVILGEGNFSTDSSAIIKRVADGLNFYTDGVNGFVDVRDVSSIMISLMKSEINNERFVICSENLSYKKVLSSIAIALKKNRPRIKATLVMSSLAWRAEAMKSFFTKQKPLVTKETAQTAQHKYFYRNEKIKKTLGVNFIPVEDSIKYWCEKFLQEKN